MWLVSMVITQKRIALDGPVDRPVDRPPPHAPPQVLKLECQAGLTEEEAVFYTSCLVLGLEGLHAKGILHRYLVPEGRGWGRLEVWLYGWAGLTSWTHGQHYPALW